MRGESLSDSISCKCKPSHSRVQSVSATVSCTPANAAETSSCVENNYNVREEPLSASISCICRPKPSDVHVESMSASESTCVDETRSQYFRVVLQKLHQCATFERSCCYHQPSTQAHMGPIWAPSGQFRIWVPYGTHMFFPTIHMGPIWGQSGQFIIWVPFGTYLFDPTIHPG